MERTIRVLLVDDSSLARALLRSYLEGDGDFEIVGEAANGEDAAELAKTLRPDLITMDLEMPVMDGFAAIERIMGTKAVPILVVSSVADSDNAYKAISLGAVDVTSKPSMAAETEIAIFLDKAKQTAHVPVITRLRRHCGTDMPMAAPTAMRVPPPTQDGIRAQDRIIAIACSTGGPQALSFILSRLPPDMKCPIVVAQHIADGFAPSMAAWLSSISALPVHVGKEAEFLEPGAIYLSPSESNMTVTRSRRIVMKPCQAGQIYHPSCDALLTSVATSCGRAAVGTILTGMGSDGVAGMQAIHDIGGMTLAQDEASSLIFGMNAASIEKGLIRQVLSLDQMAATIAALGGGTAFRGATP